MSAVWMNFHNSKWTWAHPTETIFFFITQCSAMRLGKDYNNFVYRSCGKQYCLDGMPEDESPKFAKKLFKQKYTLDCCWSNVQHVQHLHITSTLPDGNARTRSSLHGRSGYVSHLECDRFRRSRAATEVSRQRPATICFFIGPKDKLVST